MDRFVVSFVILSCYGYTTLFTSFFLVLMPIDSVM
jgi:hypothetical protein